MQISISTRHGHLSEPSQAKIRNKVEKLARHFGRLSSAIVTVDLQDESAPSVDIKVSAEHAGDFVATDTSNHLMGSVDSVVHKLEQQLRKNKGKVQERHRQPGARRQEILIESNPEEGESQSA